MLKFYYQKFSLYSRSVWIALLEKKLPFELIELALDGDQWQPEFLAINPFGRVPVLVDNNFSIFESSSILDYLELQYPTPCFLPKDIKTLTIVRMIKMLTLHELIPAMLTLIRVTNNKNAIEQANQQITAMLNFLETQLDDGLYIAGDQITLAEIVAGSVIIWLPDLNITLSNHPKVELWSNQLRQRPTWQETQPSPEIIQDWLKRIQKLPKIRARQWQQKPSI
ncbi:MAG: glutathione S-transferase family protein [Hyellaceae cyanobacterium CSU_1_1]|nr:glutathione S-transferase family protein [Hyellaceae cyanobacterium CSU_1_1]